MLWMETYLQCCSVRLGVVIIAVMTFLQLFIPAILFLSLGKRVLEPIVQLFLNDEFYKTTFIVKRSIDWFENYSQTALIAINMYLLTHMIACIMLLYGAFKLKKWFLVPFILFEFLRLVYCLIWHILLMIVLKKVHNLGVLIAITLAGGFLILYLAYNWAACVALFQIIRLIYSERYQTIYGNDPFNPQIFKSNDPHCINTHAYGTIENVRVLVTPNDNDIDELKQKQTNVVKMQQPIISVLPVSSNHTHMPYFNNMEHIPKRHKWGEKSEMLQQHKMQNEKQYHNEYYEDYNNWHWMELAGAVKNRNRLIGQNLQWQNRQN